MSMQRRDWLKSVASAGLFAAATPLVRSQQQLAARRSRHAGSTHQGHQRHRMPACGRAAYGGKDHHRPGWSLRLRLRHLHAAGRPGETSRREIPQTFSAEQDDRSHRRHLAVVLRQFLLEERAGAEQCAERHRPGALGYQGPAGGYAGVSTCGRQMPRGGRHLHTRRWRRVR